MRVIVMTLLCALAVVRPAAAQRTVARSMSHQATYAVATESISQKTRFTCS